MIKPFFLLCFVKIKGSYRNRDQKPGKEVEVNVEERLKNGGNHEVWCDGDEEHGEVVVGEKRGERRVDCPKDFVGRRIETDHWICYDHKLCGLCEQIRYLSHNLSQCI